MCHEGERGLRSKCEEGWERCPRKRVVVCCRWEMKGEEKAKGDKGDASGGRAEKARRKSVDSRWGRVD